jgi:hypothetical protein
MTEDLTSTERQFVALALRGLAMRGGPTAFPLLRSVTRKLGLVAELKDHLQDWISYKPQRSNPEVPGLE